MRDDDELTRPSAARITWELEGHEGFRTEKLRDVSARGMFVVCDDPPPVMTECRFELLGESDEVLARGRGRVVWVQAGLGVGIELLSTQLGADTLDSLRAEQLAPPRAAEVKAKKATAEVTLTTIGVDLGTSNTCASIVEDGRPAILPDRYGSNTVPSVITLDGSGEILVGAAAAKRMLLAPDKTVYGSKRLIGRAYRPEVAEEFQPFFAYPIVEAAEGRFGARLDGRTISMEEVARHILGEVLQVAGRHLKRRIDQAVVTVPAYFNEVQRDAVRRAGLAAGLESVRILSEPTAAALAYGFNRREEARVAVFDLGGGTFDISVVDVKDNRFEVVATGGDCFLGGIDFDDHVAAHLLDEFRRAERVDLEPDAQQLARLREAAADVKHGLSVQRRFAVSLPQFAEVRGEWRELSVQVDRERLEALVAPLLDRMIEITGAVLGASDIEVTSVDEVLLVGGMTRAPVVQERVEAFFGRRPSRRINPDEAVAIGAALLAREIELERGAVKLIDVLPLSIGIAGEGRRFLRLLSRQTRVPTERTFLIETREDDQATYALPVFQGERGDAAANEYLGTVVIEDIPPGSAGSQQYELEVRLDAEGVMHVSAREAKSRTRVPVRLDRARDVREVLAALGPYEGPELPPERPRPVSPLGRIFRSLLGLFRRG